MAKKRVIFATSEAVPLVKTGGLADVSGALPAALTALGMDVTVFMPLYSEILTGEFSKELKREKKVVSVPLGGGNRAVEAPLYSIKFGKVKVYLVRCDEYFDRKGLYGGTDGDYFDNLSRFAFFRAPCWKRPFS